MNKNPLEALKAAGITPEQLEQKKPAGLNCGFTPEARIKPDELRALAQVMIEMDIIDMASGDTRIVMTSAGRVPRGRPLQPVEKQIETSNQEEEEDLLYAAVP